MNTLQKTIFALISGYVISDMFRLSYNDSIYVACLSTSAILVPWLLEKLKKVDWKKLADRK